MVKSVKRCAALFCRKPFDKTDVYYRFPSSTVKDSFRLRIWQQRLLASREGKQRVCSRHFSPAQFNLRDGLVAEMRHDAVPDQNIVPRIDPNDPLDAVCRLCLERIRNDCHLIHPVWPSPDVPSAEDIEEIFGIVISNSDAIPRLICLTCVTKVNYVIRIRKQYSKNNAIYTAKWASSQDAEKTVKMDDLEFNNDESQNDVEQQSQPGKSCHQNALLIDSLAQYTSEQTNTAPEQTPKIASIVSYGKNPVSAASSSNVDPESEKVLSQSQTYSELVYVQQGNKTQRFHIISSNQILNQIGLNCEQEEEVCTTECKVLPSDPDDEVTEICCTLMSTPRTHLMLN
ncbi:uncharacterized protein LOC134218327 [Armigeres subalbatus]|uniref:uncharacterized protein LOC134218327 n=1 Tax=Armigeres subalbatus TaxID=124917 RepID=UPI002ED5B6F2